jgi:5-methylcytosine-specific restriction endonuclease McrA
LENANRINSEKRAWAAANKEKVKSRNLNFRKENPEKIRAISMNYRKENHDKVLISTKLWRFENPEKVKEYSKEYAAKNAESRRIWQQNRRARQLKNGDKLSKGLAQKLFKLQKGKCPCCKQLLGDDYHLDHIVPLALGGSNTDDNIQLLRATCNNQKSAKHPIDFMQQKGFLL